MLHRSYSGSRAQASGPRKTHRKRVSALRLSSDTTATLPEYHAAVPGVQHWQDIPSDQPPDYPDSAEEADEETDSDAQRSPFYLQQLPGASTTLPSSTPYSVTSSRKKQRFSQAQLNSSTQHKRKHSLAAAPSLGFQSRSSSEGSNDRYLDALLERSVHALEMSNTLLQSSITTQTSLSTVLATDSPADVTLEARAANLADRIRGKWDMQGSWADDLEEITRKVDGLFAESVEDLGEVTETEDDIGNLRKAKGREDWNHLLRPSASFSDAEGSLSMSLPTPMSTSQDEGSRTQHQTPSLYSSEAASSVSSTAGLHLSHCSREDLVSPPPRAVTLYVESNADPAFITLPSTVGIRNDSSVHLNADWNASTASLSLHAPLALPALTDKPLEPSTPAYNKLASFVIRRPSKSASSTPSSSFKSSFMIKRRNSNAGISKSTERGQHWLSLSAPHPRPMTPPEEEASSSSSSDSCLAKQTITSLRKILDEQQSQSLSQPAKMCKHVFMPRSPPPQPLIAASMATASISRMLTKKVHHASTRPPSPPRYSAMKGSRPTTRPSTPSGASANPNTTSYFDAGAPSSSGGIENGVTSTVARVSEAVDARRRMQSAPGSGRSTPKRISFAELPEAHVSSRPEKFRDKGKGKEKRKSKRQGSGLSLRGSLSDDDGGSKDIDEERLGVGGWFSGWLGASTRYEERMEDRMSRHWAGRMGPGYGSGCMDEWAA